MAYTTRDALIAAMGEQAVGAIETAARDGDPLNKVCARIISCQGTDDPVRVATYCTMHPDAHGECDYIPEQTYGGEE